MNFIIFDLEWNNGYSTKLKKNVNEIIEIGAVKLDSDLNVISTFKQLVKLELTKKLTSRVKQLTHITNDDLKTGDTFVKAIQNFENWVGSDDSLFMSWSNTDLYMLAGCYTYYFDDSNVDFIKKYADVQKYCQGFIDSEDNNQISLVNAANKLNIKADDENLHRALQDCMLTAKCFISVYDDSKLQQYIRLCNKDFFAKLMFKSYYVTDLKANNIKLDSYAYLCPDCSKNLVRIKDWQIIASSFRATFKCKSCCKKYWVTVRVKQEYKKITKKIRIVNYDERKNRKLINKNIEKSL